MRRLVLLTFIVKWIISIKSSQLSLFQSVDKQLTQENCDFIETFIALLHAWPWANVYETQLQGNFYDHLWPEILQMHCIVHLWDYIDKWRNVDFHMPLFSYVILKSV